MRGNRPTQKYAMTYIQDMLNNKKSTLKVLQIELCVFTSFNAVKKTFRDTFNTSRPFGVFQYFASPVRP